MHACMHACMHAYIHAYIHTYIHTYMHTYIHTYIHTLFLAVYVMYGVRDLRVVVSSRMQDQPQSVPHIIIPGAAPLYVKGAGMISPPPVARRAINEIAREASLLL